MARTNSAPLKTARWAACRAHVAHRANFRCQNPACQVYLGMTGDVDHIIPRDVCEDVGISVYDPTNLQYLCSSCHSQKTNAERWANVERKPPKPLTQRVQVEGRDAYPHLNPCAANGDIHEN